MAYKIVDKENNTWALFRFELTAKIAMYGTFPSYLGLRVERAEGYCIPPLTMSAERKLLKLQKL